MSKLSMLAAALLVGCALAEVRAQDAKPAECSKCTAAGREKGCGLSFRGLWDWATYRPCNRAIRQPYIPDPIPPLYTFILHGWGEPVPIERPHHCTNCKRGH